MVKQISQRLAASTAYLSGLPQQSRARIAHDATSMIVKRGHALVHAGDKPSGVYVIAQGRTDLMTRIPGRAPKVLGMLLPGESFGEAFLFLGRRYIYDAVAAIDSTVWFLPGPSVMDEIAKCPQFGRHMLEVLSRQLVAAIAETQSHALSGTQRFAQLLLRYASAPTARGRLHFKLPARKSEVASCIDLSPEHLSRLLRTLSNNGLISISGSMVEIIDPKGMRAIARGKASVMAARPHD